MEKEKLNRQELADQLCADPKNVPADSGWQSVLVGSDWAKILKEQPGLSGHCCWEIFSGDDWCNLLRVQPQFVDRCPIERLSGDNLFYLLSAQPQLHTKITDWRITWRKMHPIKISLLLSRHPELATEERLALLDNLAWRLLLDHAPQLAVYCNMEKFRASDWNILLGKQPQLINRWSPEYLPEQTERRYALESFYEMIFHCNKLDWTTKCMVNELTKSQHDLERPDHRQFNGIFKICDENNSAETFVMLSMMDPACAADFLQKKIRQQNWELIRKIVNLKPALLFKLLDVKTFVPYFIMNAPADLTLFAVRRSGSFAGEYIDSCKCNCFHALFIRIAENDPKWFAAPPEHITELYHALLAAGCDPDLENLQHHSFNSLAENIRKHL